MLFRPHPAHSHPANTHSAHPHTLQVFTSENYLANWVQSLFSALGAEVEGKTLALGGDGRYFCKEAAQIIIKLAAGNGFKKVGAAASLK
eukprot:358619-Chlamydomonas_euryale.AAC.9